MTWIFFFLILCILRFGNIKIIAWPWSFLSWCRFCISLRPSPSYLEVKNYCMRCSFITQIFVENLLLGRKQSKVMGQRMVGVGIGPGSILYRMVWDNLLEEIIFDLSSEWCKSGERITGRWCSKHKGSEAEISLMSSWNRRAVWLGYSGQGGEWNDMKFEKGSGQITKGCVSSAISHHMILKKGWFRRKVIWKPLALSNPLSFSENTLPNKSSWS